MSTQHLPYNPMNIDSLIKSIISKMMYTCNDPYCKHRLNGMKNNKNNYCGACTARHFNCLGTTGTNCMDTQHLQHSTTANFRASPNKPCKCFANTNSQNNPELITFQNKSKINHNYSYQIAPAGNYSSQQSRAKWINNSLQDGSRMKQILYQSENPFANVHRKSDSSDNYDKLYAIQQNKIMNTKTFSPKAISKIMHVVKEDRQKSK